MTWHNPPSSAPLSFSLSLPLSLSLSPSLSLSLSLSPLPSLHSLTLFLPFRLAPYPSLNSKPTTPPAVRRRCRDPARSLRAPFLVWAATYSSLVGRPHPSGGGQIFEGQPRQCGRGSAQAPPGQRRPSRCSASPSARRVAQPPGAVAVEADDRSLLLSPPPLPPTHTRTLCLSVCL